MPFLEDVRSLVRAARPPALQADAVAATLLHLGWASDAVAVVRAHDVDAHLLEVAAANETQALIVLGREGRFAADRVSLGYSREAPYTLFWGAEELALFDPSWWRESPGDLPLAAADLGSTASAAAVFELLHRDSILERVPSSYQDDGRRHEVLHETLAKAVTRLRLAVAQQDAFAGQPPAAHDAQVLRLFHQLLFIRFQEDWGRSASKLRLRDLLERSDPGHSLPELVRAYRTRLNSELFAEPEIQAADLPSDALTEVIKALVAPWEELRLNFSVSRAEIAGRLYQSYLRQTPAVEASPARGSSLLPLVGPEDQQSRHGSYYTPSSVARYLTEATLDRYLLSEQPATPEDVRILDPACGSGAFLIAAYRRLLRYFEELHGPLDAEFRQRLLVSSIFGADIDERAIGLAQVQLLEEADLAPGAALPALGHNLLIGDSLLAPPGEIATPGAVDWTRFVEAVGAPSVVLMNPPFGTPTTLARHLSVRDRQHLREQYAEVREWGSDYAYFFVALALRLVVEGGEVATILPRTALVGPSARGVRESIAGRRISSITDFRGLKLFEGVDSYVCAISFGAQAPRGGATVAVVADSRQQPHRILDDLNVERDGFVRRATVPQRLLRQQVSAGWGAFRLRWLEIASELGRRTEPLAPDDGRGERTVVHGTQSGADQRLMIAPTQWQPEADARIRVDNVVIGSRYAPRLVRGANIHPFRVDQDGTRLLVPYENDGRLTQDAAVLEVLEKRGGPALNAQPGDLGTLRSPKLLIRRFAREPAAFADLVGDLMITKGSGGALAVRLPAGAEALLQGLEALTHSSLAQWLLRGLGGPRADETVELSVAIVASLPWPALDYDEWERLAAAGAAVREALGRERRDRVGAYWRARQELDDVVEELLRPSRALQRVIRREILREA